MLQDFTVCSIYTFYLPLTRLEAVEALEVRGVARLKWELGDSATTATTGPVTLVHSALT